MMAVLQIGGRRVKRAELQRISAAAVCDASQRFQNVPSMQGMWR